MTEWEILKKLDFEERTRDGERHLFKETDKGYWTYRGGFGITYQRKGKFGFDGMFLADALREMAPNNEEVEEFCKELEKRYLEFIDFRKELKNAKK